MSHLVRRYRIAFVQGAFHGTFCVWAPNTSTAKTVCRSKRIRGTFDYIEVIGEDPPPDTNEELYPIAKPGAYSE